VTDDGDPNIVVRSLLNGSVLRLSNVELGLVLSFPTVSWTWRREGDPSVDRLARAGLVVSDEPVDPFAGLRLRDEELTDRGWFPDAAAFHIRTRWDGVRADVRDREGRLSRRRARVGVPVPAFPVRGGPRTALPLSGGESGLRQLLTRRKTVRAFDQTRPVEVAEVATLLRWVWGAHGTIDLAGDDIGLRRTSPSGGSLHPIEVYPIVRCVQGLTPGLYHYLGGEHALERIEELDESAARSLVEGGTAGQWYFADANVAFVMTARFRRSFHKYRRHAKAYRTVLLDAGHLSQTFYLLCTELELGPWVTAALDDSVLESALGVEPLEEGIIAMCGCGRPTADGTDFLAPPVKPLDPK
jgi:putative peptide maturation dehydrogenase